MNAEKRNLLRNAILIQLESMRPATLNFNTIKQGARLCGFNSLENDILKAEILYLEDKGLIHSEPSKLSPAYMRYSLTSGGQDYLESEGLAS